MNQRDSFLQHDAPDKELNNFSSGLSHDFEKEGSSYDKKLKAEQDNSSLTLVEGS